MRTAIIRVALFLLAGFWSEAARAQTNPGRPDLVPFKKAYDALDEKLPAGRRVVIDVDPFLGSPPAQRSEISRETGRSPPPSDWPRRRSPMR
ncbi:MAG TPA: hypothetical protein VF158_06775 [Longimicrobiales bacterium]